MPQIGEAGKQNGHINTLATLRYITLGGANRPTGDPDVAVLPSLT